MLELFAPDMRFLLQDILVVCVCLAAFVWGGGPERMVAATWVLVFELPLFAHRAFFGGDFQLAEVDYVLATMDIAAGLIWIGIALYANRLYILGIAGLQVLAVMAHMARGLAEAISPIAYLTMVVAPGWGQLLLLGIGVFMHVRRKNTSGMYRDWRKPNAYAGTLSLKGFDNKVLAMVSRWDSRRIP